MLTMFSDLYARKALQVDGASRRRFRLKPKPRRRSKDAPVRIVDHARVLASLQSSYLEACSYASATGFDHARRREQEALDRLRAFQGKA